MNPAGIESEILVVYLARGRSDLDGRPTVIKGPKLVTIAGRNFITGRLLSYPNYWASEKRIHLALDSIDSMIEFESEELYKQMKAQHYRGRAKPWRFLFWSGGKK